jgi:hypothetical protein
LLHPKRVIWISLDVLTGLGCAVLAVGFFWMWQRLGHPVIAYLDGGLYALLALLAALVPLTKWRGASDTQGVPGSQLGLGPRSGLEKQKEPGTGSA